MHPQFQETEEKNLIYSILYDESGMTFQIFYCQIKY